MCQNITQRRQVEEAYSMKGLDNMTLQEYEEEGRCNGCMFYQNIEPEAGKVCTFHWFDDESGDWDYGKNCDEISD